MAIGLILVEPLLFCSLLIGLSLQEAASDKVDTKEKLTFIPATISFLFGGNHFLHSSAIK